MKILNKEFDNKREMFDFIKSNKEDLIKMKKLEMVKSDAVSFVLKTTTTKSKISEETDTIKVSVIMNTTNWFDSHSDVHLKGIWNKTLSDNKTFYHLQEHKRSFDAVISDNSNAYVKNIAWKDLGVNIDGTTEALIFESEISKERNPFMFEQYAKGYVKNHSVGMQYVKLELAYYDEEDEAELDFWNKYIVEVANREDAEAQGYFWIVKEAKLIEGSAVLFGSNSMTPTLNIEPSKDTQVEGSRQIDTSNKAHNERELINFYKTILN